MARYRIGIWLVMTVLAAASVPGGQPDSWAGKPIYSYVDDRGNLVATDRLEDIPARYRSRVKVTERLVQPETPGSRRASTPAAFGEDLLVRLIDRVPSTIIPGLTAYQTVMLGAGFLAILLVYGAGKLTGSPFWRMLMPWAIGFLAVATIYFMFVSDLSDKVAARAGEKSQGSLVHQFREKGKNLAEKKGQRLKQADQVDGQE